MMKNLLALLLTFSIFAGTAEAGGRSSSSSSSSSGRSSMSSSSRSSSSGSSGKSFSGGRSSSSGGKSYSAPSKTTTTAPAKTTGKSFNGGKSASGTTITKSKSTYDQETTKKYKEQESRAAYKEKFEKPVVKKGETTKTEYKNKQGKTVKIDPKDVKIEKLKKSLDDHKWENRQLRMQNTYQKYYSQPILYPPVYYSDGYNSVFWYWMLDRSLEERAMWAYCHRDDMDRERYRALLAKDAQLEAKIEQLKSQRVAVDPTYVPKGADLDTTYQDELVEAVYNPTPAPQVHYTPRSGGLHISWGWLCFGATLTVLVLLVLFALFYRY